MKECSQCKKILEDSSFHKSSRNKDGLYSRCKICRKGEHTPYYEKDKELNKSRAKKWKEENGERITRDQKIIPIE